MELERKIERARAKDLLKVCIAESLVGGIPNEYVIPDEENGVLIPVLGEGGELPEDLFIRGESYEMSVSRESPLSWTVRAKPAHQGPVRYFSISVKECC